MVESSRVTDGTREDSLCRITGWIVSPRCRILGTEEELLSAEGRSLRFLSRFGEDGVDWTTSSAELGEATGSFSFLALVGFPAFTPAPLNAASNCRPKPITGRILRDADVDVAVSADGSTTGALTSVGFARGILGVGN